MSMCNGMFSGSSTHERYPKVGLFEVIKEARDPDELKCIKKLNVRTDAWKCSILFLLIAVMFIIICKTKQILINIALSDNIAL
jgi:hypothetical protein